MNRECKWAGEGRLGKGFVEIARKLWL